MSDAIEDEPKKIIIPYTPRAWQAEMHRKMRRFTVLPVHRGAGKLLELDTLIATPNGFTTMGEISLGDTVIDRDGQYCTVTNVSAIQTEPCYEIEFSTGEKFVCHEDHEWLTQTTREKQNEQNRANPRNRKANPQSPPNGFKRGEFTGLIESPKTTRQILETLEKNYVSRDGFREKNHRVHVTPAIEFGHKDLPIDPWMLGYWLGNGTTLRPEVTIGAHDEAAFLEQASISGVDTLKYAMSAPEKICYRIGISGKYKEDRSRSMTQLLRDLGVLGLKHIPQIYLRSSIAQRWRLLQGLMDSDGHAPSTGSGKTEITFVKQRLIEDTHELMCSLGLKPGRIVESEAKIGDKSYGPKWRIALKGFAHQPIFSFPRKQSLLPECGATGHNYQRNRMIVAVRPVPTVPTRCIEVDSPTHTYCIGRSFIPTHNSVFAMNELIRRAMTGPRYAEYAYILPLRNQAQRNIMDPLKRFIAPIPGVNVNNATLTVRFPNGSKIYVLGADDPDKLRGMHLHYLCLDEVADMHPETWLTVRPMLTNHRGGCLFIGTPKGHNMFYDLYMLSQKPENSEWYGEIMPYQKTKALDEIEVALARQTLTDNGFAQELECSFEAAIRGAYYGDLLGELREAGQIVVDKLYRDDLEVITGWDLGIRDHMAVWFAQVVRDKIGGPPQINFIDYVAESGLGFPQWSNVLTEKSHHYGYRYGTHVAPFDIKNRELGSGISRLESAQASGIRFEQCPKQDPMDGIELVRKTLPTCKFYAPLCHDGIESLAMYRAKIDREGHGLGPDHNVHSHAADSMRYLVTYIVQVMCKPSFIRLPFLRRR